MDRQIVYPGSIPLDTDLLHVQRYTMEAIAALARCVLGPGPLLDGLACVPAGVSYAVTIKPGTFSATLPVDAKAFGSLAPDQVQIVKTGVHRQDLVLQLRSPPDRDHAICWLVQAALLEYDEGAVALPYWNAANPTIPFSGPGNSGLAQNTQRLQRVQLACKASDPLPTWGLVPPAPDPGWIGLYSVTTWFGKPVIAPEDIQILPGAPLLQFRLPDLTPGFSRQAAFGGNTVWNVPAGVRGVRVRLVGGGGGGGGCDADYSGGGGGAGGYAESVVQVSPGQAIPVIVGVGGAAGPPGGMGGTGGATFFGDLVAASGGAGGGGNNPDSHGGGGGAGTAGGILQFGGCGGDGARVASVPGGGGGAGAFGGGGRGAYFGGLPADGKAAGSGGGGGYGPGSSGGLGASGLVIVEY